METKINISETPEDLASSVAQKLIQKFEKTSSTIHIALSGGSTPKLLFQKLAKFAEEKFWQNIHLYWGDERCVSPENEESNFGVTKKLLLDHIQIPPQNIHRIQGERDPKEESFRYKNLLQKNLKKIQQIPSFDIILLGLGNDGHTASIFPNQINSAPEELCKIAIHPETNQKRISLTLKAINQGSEILFLVAGKNKAEMVHHILETKNKKFPATHVNPKQGNIYWYLDTSAASKLGSISHNI